MTNILIIGAHGQIARVATRHLLARTDAVLTLYLRRAKMLDAMASNPRVRIIAGDATDPVALEAAMAGQDVVYANLSGDGSAGDDHRRSHAEGRRAPPDLRQLDGNLW